uniref:C-type lectin domain-containing protein n=1 Tax=Poecilia latipinna TaxID=48699 RepID=A0A3B3VGF0_9TELE
MFGNLKWATSPTPGDGLQLEKPVKLVTSRGPLVIQTSDIQGRLTEHNLKQFVFIATLKTWSSAQTYCRMHHTDLAMIENEAENSEVRHLIPVGVDVWIGLYRVPWSWSDKSPSRFQRWGNSEPNNVEGIQHCVCENTLHQWGDERCHATKVFICEQGDC